MKTKPEGAVHGIIQNYKREEKFTFVPLTEEEYFILKTMDASPERTWLAGLKVF